MLVSASAVSCEVMCITGYLVGVQPRRGSRRAEGQLLGRPLRGRLIAVIISACSDVGVFFWTSESGQFQSNFPCAGISLHHAKCTKKGELLAESLKPSPEADLIRETAANGAFLCAERVFQVAEAIIGSVAQGCEQLGDFRWPHCFCSILISRCPT